MVYENLIQHHHTWIWYNKGLMLAALGRYEEAIVAYDQFLRLEPQDQDAYEQKGEALLALYPNLPPLQRKESSEMGKHEAGQTP